MQCRHYDSLFHGMSFKIKQKHLLFWNVKHVSSCSTLLHTWSIFGQPPIQRVPRFFPQRQSGRSVEHVRPCSTGVGNEWSCNSTLLYASNACARAILPFILATTVHKPQFFKFISCYVSPVLGVWFPRCVARLWGRNSMFIHYIQNRRFQKGHALAQAVRCRRPKGLWDRPLPEYLDFPLFVSLPHHAPYSSSSHITRTRRRSLGIFQQSKLFVFQTSVKQKCTFALLSPFSEDTMPMVMAAHAVKCIVQTSS